MAGLPPNLAAVNCPSPNSRDQHSQRVDVKPDAPMTTRAGDCEDGPRANHGVKNCCRTPQVGERLKRKPGRHPCRKRMNRVSPEDLVKTDSASAHLAGTSPLRLNTSARNAWTPRDFARGSSPRVPPTRYIELRLRLTRTHAVLLSPTCTMEVSSFNERPTTPSCPQTKNTQTGSKVRRSSASSARVSGVYVNCHGERRFEECLT